MKKIIISIICLVTVIAVTILPTFAFTQSNDTASKADCVFTINGTGYYMQQAYIQMNGEYFFNTYGDVLIFTANRVRVDGANYREYPISEYGYYVYFNADDNRGSWLFNIYDVVNDEWSSYDALSTNIYAFATVHGLPIIYNQNIEVMIVNYHDQAFDSNLWFPFWSAFKMADTTMVSYPSSMSATQSYQSGYDVGYGVGKADGLTEGYNNGVTVGFSQGQTDIVKTSGTLRQFISAIFTAPSHFINTIFDFELFGFNVAGIVRTILALLILALVATFIIKLIL